jgi:hypothetical protein
MAYSKAKLKSSGDKASPCFLPFWKGKLSDSARITDEFSLNLALGSCAGGGT